MVEDVYLFVETDFETASFIHLGEEFNGTDVLMTLESRTNCNNIYVRGEIMGRSITGSICGWYWNSNKYQRRERW